MKNSNLFFRLIFLFSIPFAGFNVAIGQTFQPADFPYSGADLNEAVNNALRDWETQYGKSENYLGSVNINLAVANDQLVFSMHNAIRAAVNGKTLGAYTFNTPQLTSINTTLNNFGTNWKKPRRIEHYINNCDGSVHFLDTAVVFSCAHPTKSPIWQWHKYGISNAQAAFDGESNGEFPLDPDEGQTQNFRDATEGSFYFWWFVDAAASWGHLTHMIRSTTTKLGYVVFYLDEANGNVSTYMWTQKAELVLPVELVDFKVQRELFRNLLRWSTASESNNLRFEIERSADGWAWDKIGWLVGKGTATDENNYAWNDEQPPSGLTFYRLIQVDADGEKNVSPIRSVFRSLAVDFSVSPNPVVGSCSLNFSIPHETELTLNISNMSGEIVKTMLFSTPNGQVSTLLDLSDLPAGVFVLQATTHFWTKTTMLFKQ